MIKEEAIKMLKRKMDGHTDTSYEWAETVRMTIKALEQEPKTGIWIYWTDDRKDYLKCSVCGYGEEGEVDYSTFTPYCPMCGAKMIEP